MVKSSYEDLRRQRLEENKKRMEDLNLTRLAQNLKTPTPKTTPTKPKIFRQKQLEFVVVRRSSRFANKPAPSYKEVPIDVVERTRRIFKGRDFSNRVYASDEARSYAFERAEKLQSGLESQFPSFVKSMLPSHVSGGFWLGLPLHFCKMNLPKSDGTITLIDENENEYPTVYLPRKTGLSGGWMRFSLDHELVDGDALVFQLIHHTKFKVFIIRANAIEESDEAS